MNKPTKNNRVNAIVSDLMGFVTKISQFERLNRTKLDEKEIAEYLSNGIPAVGGMSRTNGVSLLKNSVHLQNKASNTKQTSQPIASSLPKTKKVSNNQYTPIIIPVDIFSELLPKTSDHVYQKKDAISLYVETIVEEALQRKLVKIKFNINDIPFIINSSFIFTTIFPYINEKNITKPKKFQKILDTVEVQRMLEALVWFVHMREFEINNMTEENQFVNLESNPAIIQDIYEREGWLLTILTHGYTSVFVSLDSGQFQHHSDSDRSEFLTFFPIVMAYAVLSVFYHCFPACNEVYTAQFLIDVYQLVSLLFNGIPYSVSLINEYRQKFFIVNELKCFSENSPVKIHSKIPLSAGFNKKENILKNHINLDSPIVLSKNVSSPNPNSPNKRCFSRSLTPDLTNKNRHVKWQDTDSNRPKSQLAMNTPLNSSSSSKNQHYHLQTPKPEVKSKKQKDSDSYKFPQLPSSPSSSAVGTKIAKKYQNSTLNTPIDKQTPITNKVDEKIKTKTNIRSNRRNGSIKKQATIFPTPVGETSSNNQIPGQQLNVDVQVKLSRDSRKRLLVRPKKFNSLAKSPLLDPSLYSVVSLKPAKDIDTIHLRHIGDLERRTELDLNLDEEKLEVGILTKNQRYQQIMKDLHISEDYEEFFNKTVQTFTPGKKAVYILHPSVNTTKSSPYVNGRLFPLGIELNGPEMDKINQEIGKVEKNTIDQLIENEISYFENKLRLKAQTPLERAVFVRKMLERSKLYNRNKGLSVSLTDLKLQKKKETLEAQVDKILRDEKLLQNYAMDLDKKKREFEENEEVREEEDVFSLIDHSKADEQRRPSLLPTLPISINTRRSSVIQLTERTVHPDTIDEDIAVATTFMNDDVAPMAVGRRMSTGLAMDVGLPWEDIIDPIVALSEESDYEWDPADIVN
eukprot:TRINITY_DN1872_c0_g1_i1.p1 TRINITY_DN1872_c0_g1~~TRINITY_DN1872_c0_g1_i1.p1  ORF type:complete len:912 (-),score=246.07 TRINITY_DN1872_c0_g1_i1:45-2780(-)